MKGTDTLSIVLMMVVAAAAITTMVGFGLHVKDSVDTQAQFTEVHIRMPSNAEEGFVSLETNSRYIEVKLEDYLRLNDLHFNSFYRSYDDKLIEIKIYNKKKELIGESSSPLFEARHTTVQCSFKEQLICGSILPEEDFGFLSTTED